MKVLFISKKGLASNLARIMKGEGHKVRYFIGSSRLKDVFDGIVEKTDDWKKDLKWVGKKGLIVFDDNGYGKIQEDLRGQGYCVFGGCKMADKMEYNREFTQKLFTKYNINTNMLKSFNKLKDVPDFIKNNPGKWVIKRDGDNSKFVSYSGEHPQGQDVIEILENYLKDKNLANEPVSIQEKIDGIEIGVGRYFNGKNFIGPIEINLEHPNLFAGDIGPFTDEMGTVAWYTNRKIKIYKETLAKLENFLREIDFRGDVAINCIVNKNNIVALETTARLGCPIVHLQSIIHDEGWGNWLKKVASGQDAKLKWKRGVGVVFSISVPPFPFEKHFSTNICCGLTIHLDDISPQEEKHIHFDEVVYDKKNRRLHVSHQTDGFILYVTGFGKNITEARKKALKTISKIYIPKMFYRTDIGEKFEVSDKEKLKNWGWI